MHPCPITCCTSWAVHCLWPSPDLAHLHSSLIVAVCMQEPSGGCSIKEREERLVQRGRRGVASRDLMVCGMQDDDIPGIVRYHTYEVLKKEVNNPRLRWAYLPYSMHMAGPREAIQHMIIRKNYGAQPRLTTLCCAPVLQLTMLRLACMRALNP